MAEALAFLLGAVGLLIVVAGVASVVCLTDDSCDCPAYRLRHQSGRGSAVKTFHRTHCAKKGWQ